MSASKRTKGILIYRCLLSFKFLLFKKVWGLALIFLFQLNPFAVPFRIPKHCFHDKEILFFSPNMDEKLSPFLSKKYSDGVFCS